MVTLLIAVGLSLQQVQASAVVDRNEVELGQEIVLTLRIAATATQPVRIFNPPFPGFEIQGTTEFREVNVGDSASTRVMRREIRLKPTRTGTITIGSVRVTVGESVVATDAIEVTVVPAQSVVAPGLLPHVRTLIEQREPEGIGPEEVLVEVLTGADSVMLGDQLDLVVVAWFPRGIRTRLRNPPTMHAPQIQGAWTYPQGTPGAIAMSRRVGGEIYDVYVHHQILFPLTPGLLPVGAAMVSYSLPLTYSFLSREVRHEPRSEEFNLAVLPQPNAGRPNTFDGAAGASLGLEVSAERTDLGLGDATAVIATVSGRGNVALWPEPRFEWPTGLRVYPEAVDVELDSRDDGMWGTKQFRYLVVADGFGTHRIPPVRYSFFDLALSEYATLTSPTLELHTEGGPIGAFGDDERRALPLISPGVFTWVERAVRSIPLWVLPIVVLCLPGLAAAMRVISARRVRHKVPVTQKKGRPGVLAGQLDAALRTLVDDPQLLDGRRLANVLRAAGIDRHLATHAARVRDRLWQADYGPEGEIDPEELRAEVEEVLQTLTGRRSEVGSVTAGIAVLILLALPIAQSHAQSAERLYELGAFKQASDSFQARANDEPYVSAHWHNLGGALYGMGLDVRARSAWLTALRLDPRNSRIRSALELGAGQVSDDLPWVSPVTPTEALLGAGAFWAVAWMLIGMRRRRRVVLPIVVAALALFGYGGYVSLVYSRPLALVTGDDTPLRAAPFGPAPVVRELLSGSTVTIRSTRPGWALVERRGDLGWLKSGEIAPL